MTDSHRGGTKNRTVSNNTADGWFRSTWGRHTYKHEYTTQQPVRIVTNVCWYRSVGTVTGLGNKIFEVRISEGASNFFLLPKHTDRPWLVLKMYSGGHIRLVPRFSTRPDALLERTRTALAALYTPFPSSATVLYRTPRQQQRTAQINGGGTCYTAPLSPRVAQISVRTYCCRRPRGGSIMDRA